MSWMESPGVGRYDRLAMISSPIVIAALVSLVAAAVTIVLIHHSAVMERFLSRWIWLLLALLTSLSAARSLQADHATEALLGAAVAAVCFWSFASGWRQERKRQFASLEAQEDSGGPSPPR